jgi:uncharacterized protein YyaL (SSP411 family)
MPKLKNSPKKRANKLIHEKSPYLFQHAYNPVIWFPWGTEAFKKAKKEDKPIFLSIGYSTCHWCHVMEKESFEDSEVAKMLNDTFVSIKVDREERPDIDSVYMKVCQMMTGSGGWPLHIVMTSEKKPFFATTYIPKESRFGRVGLKELVPRIRDLWNSQRDKLIDSSEKVIFLLNQMEKIQKTKKGEDLEKSALDEAFVYFLDNFDEFNGGFGSAPKFPTAHNLSFLLRYWNRKGLKKAKMIVEKTLEAMRLGGIFDHLGFGFHRYSTDSKWLVPHFEKMLYDQAMLTILYTEAYQATKREEFGLTARQIIQYVLRDLTALNGGFFTAEDADSEGEEGKFYLWKEEEIKRLLTKDEAKIAIKIFNLKENGNFEDESTKKTTGKNILYLKKHLAEHQEQMVKIRKKLFSAREKRIHPNKDDKILTNWNGLMIASLAKAAQVFNMETYSNAARKAADFILSRMINSDGCLYHRYRKGEAAISGFLDDYAFLVWGLIELYEAIFEVKYLKWAVSLTEKMIELFWDKKDGGFFLTAKDAENVLVREKPIYDSAYPSANSISILNLLRLSRITANIELEKMSQKTLRLFSKAVLKAPAGYTQLLIALDFFLGPSFEVVIVGEKKAENTAIILKALRKLFVPNKILLFRPSTVDQPKIARLSKFTKNLVTKKGKTTVYVCQGFKCNLPTTKIEEAIKLLMKK